MSNTEKLDHLGELAARDAAGRARDILRFVLKIMCFISMILYYLICAFCSLSCYDILLFYFFIL